MINVADLPPLGAFYQGGHYAGLYKQNGDLYALIVARLEGEFKDMWHPEYTDVTGASSDIDGFSNTQAMALAGSLLAKTILELNLGGFNDWFLPAKNQLEICYRNLKPTTETNHKGYGENPDSYPVGCAYTETNPVQTTAYEFIQRNSPDVFRASWYWSSTQHSARFAHDQVFDDGYQYHYDKNDKTYGRAVRCFRVC